MSKDIWDIRESLASRVTGDGLYSGWRQITLCKMKIHCRRSKLIQKFDGGKLPQLCCYCMLIVEWGPVKK
jgi:hypothetical protein